MLLLYCMEGQTNIDNVKGCLYKVFLFMKYHLKYRNKSLLFLNLNQWIA